MLKKDVIAVSIIIGIGLLIRLDFLIAANFSIDSDEAIVGLMGKHIIEGLGVPAFYYGQHYMGSLEAIIVGLLGSVIGFDNVTLKLVPLVFSLLFIVIVYLTGYELSGRLAARIGGLLAALSPVAFIIWSTKARGGFIEVVVLGSFATLLLIRAMKYKKISHKYLFVIGILLGLGWWVNNQIIYFIIPIFIYTTCYCFSVFTILSIIKLFIISSFGFLLGSLPYWLYNLENSFASFSIFQSAQEGKAVEYTFKFFNESLPILLGARKFWTYEDNFPAATQIAFALYGILIIAYLIRRYKRFLGMFVLRFNYNYPREILILILFTAIFIFAFSSYGHLSVAPRYLLPIYYPIFVLSGIILSDLYKRYRVVGTMVFVYLICLNVISCYYPARQLMGQPFTYENQRVSKDHTELISWLKNNNHSWVRTNYWIGYRLAYETQEDIRFLVFAHPYMVRIKSYEAQGMFYSRSAPIVLVTAEANVIKKAFKIAGYDYKVEHLSDYEVIYDYGPSQTDLQETKHTQPVINVTDNYESAIKMIDGDLQTRWGSGRPQARGMKVEIEFDQAIDLRALNYELAGWRHDYPRKFSVELIDQNGETKTILSPKDFPYIHYLFLAQQDHQYSFYFPEVPTKKIVLSQLGQDATFDWSIAELSWSQ